MTLQVQLNTFEGPLSLLLYLIKKNELDIYDIPINDITQQYLEYIKIMKELNLEVAGEFIAMAATLIYVKSRMLVPQYNEKGEEIQEDPRKELVQKLLEFQKFQEAGKLLYKRPLLNRDLWSRGQKEERSPVNEEIILDERGLFALIAAFRDLLKDAKKSTHEVTGKGLSISARLMEIKHKFRAGEKIELRDLLGQTYTKVDLIINFLCVLELCRMKFARVYQTEPFAPLYIETIREISTDFIGMVQEFDSSGSQQTANQIMAEAEQALGQMTMSEEALNQISAEELENDSEVKAVESGEGLEEALPELQESGSVQAGLEAELAALTEIAVAAEIEEELKARAPISTAEDLEETLLEAEIENEIYSEETSGVPAFPEEVDEDFGIEIRENFKLKAKENLGVGVKEDIGEGIFADLLKDLEENLDEGSDTETIKSPAEDFRKEDFRKNVKVEVRENFRLEASGVTENASAEPKEEVVSIGPFTEPNPGHEEGNL